MLDFGWKIPADWISNGEGFLIHMAKFGLKGKMSDKDFMTFIMNNVLEEYVILDGLENCLTSSGSDTATIEVTHETLNNSYKKIEEK